MPACSKTSTLMPMGRPSGSLLNHTPSLQFGICDRTRFRLAVANSLPLSYGEVFGIVSLNDQINTVLLSAIKRDSD